MPCQIGSMIFLSGCSSTNREFNSYSVHFFFRRNALEKTTIPYRQFTNPRSIDDLKSSPHSNAFLSNHTRIPAALRALTSGSDIRFILCRVRDEYVEKRAIFPCRHSRWRLETSNLWRFLTEECRTFHVETTSLQ